MTVSGVLLCNGCHCGTIIVYYYDQHSAFTLHSFSHAPSNNLAVSGNEMSCVGIATSDVSDPDYTSSSDMWMIRGYNGSCYHGGSVVKTISKFHPGDVLTFTLDVAAGSLGVAINFKDEGIVFTDVPKSVHREYNFASSCTANIWFYARSPSHVNATIHSRCGILWSKSQGEIYQ